MFGIQHQDWKCNGPQDDVAIGMQYEQVESVHVNLIWSPVKSVNLGLEYMWGYNQGRNLASGAGVVGGSRGYANQLQFSAQYVF